MRFFSFTVWAAAFTMLITSSAFAMDPNMHDGMKIAKCPAGDPAVIVNTKSMTYMMDTKANRDSMKGMMSHDKFICKSKADKMGAHMKSGAMKSNKM